MFAFNSGKVWMYDNVQTVTDEKTTNEVLHAAEKDFLENWIHTWRRVVMVYS